MLRKLEKWHVVVLLTLLAFGVAIVFWPAGQRQASIGPLPEAPVIETRGPPRTYVTDRAPFAVAFKGVESDLRLMSLFVMPGDAVDFEVTADPRFEITLTADSGVVAPTAPNRWRWTAPSRPGLYGLRFEAARVREAMILRAFVKVPFHPDSLEINGYRIGTYGRQPYRDNPFYTFPDGFVEVKPDLLEERVTPHFTLGQFVAKQVSGYPKYLLLHERLLVKLETLLRLVNESGIATPSLHVMSGFRTPHYNRLIGNATTYSVHLYGGAADVFVDVDGDTYMDDVNGDGTADVADARWMAGLIESQMDEPWFEPFVGGLGIYSPAPHRGPFIHVDVRGEPARW
ncbi:MAG TPA: D-Ala-D-Ala carboxypeptidase family metallohydrolase [Rhodothermales bacterium]